ncbi:MAG: SGNH/GDSL hydrolase family protein [Microbacterium sp.]|nr:SGNH/GDSL hydrolase family protein [Microbacterium sp.]
MGWHGRMTASRAAAPRPAVVAAVGTVAAAGLVFLGARAMLVRQAAVARRRIGKPFDGDDAVDSDRVWGARFEGRPLELVVLGDSIAAGLGAERRKDTLGARLAKGLARAQRRRVRLRTAAVVGAESSMLAAQIDGLPDDYRPDVAVIVVGGNDVTHRVSVSTSVGHLDEAVGRLQDLGAAVVVGTCPDLGSLRPVPQPLRALGARLSRQLADAQAEVVARRGARAVSLRRAVGPFFVTQPEEMFSLDRFHPSALGYRRTAEALLPAVRAALAEAKAAAKADARSAKADVKAAAQPTLAPSA